MPLPTPTAPPAPAHHGAIAFSCGNDVVLRGADRRLYVTLSLVVLAAVVAFGWWWARMAMHGVRPLSYLVGSIVLVCELGIWWARWAPLARMRRPRHEPPAPNLRVAVVTTIVPGHEPLAMLEQSLSALVGVRYPHDTWVLDEGNDPAVRAVCARVGVHHASRRESPEYRTTSGRYAINTKHGNYNFWLDTVGAGRYDVLVTFDTDHVPEPDYLERTLGHLRDPGVGYVQPPQVYYNQSASFIARGAAEETYGYYSSHQMANYALGHPIVVGSHGVHRMSALLAVGGFPDHQAEDLYLTIYYRAAGWRGVYVPEILALGTTPVDWRSYLPQQVRWARAVLDLKRTALRRAVGPLPVVDQLISLFHGAHFLRPLLWLLLFPVLIALLLNNAVPIFLRPGALGMILGMGILLNLTDRFRQRFYLDPEREQGTHWRAAVTQFAKWPHFAGALLDAILGRTVPYALTAKAAGGTGRFLVAPLHLALATTVALAWAVGRARHGQMNLTLSSLALLVGGASLMLAWTETRHYPPPFDPTLLPLRRSQLKAVFRRCPD